eukprot:555807-Pyramimonas_sp.AAC.1
MSTNRCPHRVRDTDWHSSQQARECPRSLRPSRGVRGLQTSQAPTTWSVPTRADPNRHQDLDVH